MYFIRIYINTSQYFNITMSGRKQDYVWLYFDKTKVVGKAGWRATCRKCDKQMDGRGNIKINRFK